MFSADHSSMHVFPGDLMEVLERDIQEARARSDPQWKQVKPSCSAAARRSAFRQLLANAFLRAERSRTLLTPLDSSDGTSLGDLAFDLEALSLDETLIVLTEALAHGRMDRNAFDQLLAHQYLAARIGFLDEDFLYRSDGGRDCGRMHWLQCLLVSHGSWTHARWLGRFLMNFHRGGQTRFPDAETNPQIQGVLHLIAKISEDDAWPDEGGVGDHLGPYKPLIESVTDPRAFAQALERLMDFRMARYNSHQDVDVPGRSSKWSGILASEYWALIPAEVMAISALAKRYLGVELELNIDHPWLRQPLAQALPPINVEWENAGLAALKDRIRDAHGADCFDLALPPFLSVEQVQQQLDSKLNHR